MRRNSVDISYLMMLFIYAAVSVHEIHAQWVVQQADNKSDLTDVVMLNDTTAIAVGMSQTILKTTDAGMSWRFIPTVWSIRQDWNTVAFFGTSIGVLAGNNIIVTTTDGGEHWEYRLHADTTKFISAICLGPSKYYVGDQSGYIHTTKDSGKNWSAEKISIDPIRSLFAFRGTYLWTYPVYALTPHSLYKRLEPSDSGEWTMESDNIFAGLGSEAWGGESAFGGGHTFIAGVGGDLWSAMTVLRKKMSDTVWSNVMAEFPQEGVLYGISVPSNLVVYACGTKGMVVKSTDGGESWLSQKTPAVNHLRAIYFNDEAQGFAVGDSGTILFTSNGGMTGVESNPDHVRYYYTLHQNYPNPFNPATMLSYELPVSVFVTLKVYDVIGREVAVADEGLRNAGLHTVRFDASALAGGVYFYRLRAGNYTATRKLIVLR